MEPRHHCRGNDAAERGLELVDALQWSRGITAAETDDGARDSSAVAALQWSRGITAAETAERRKDTTKCHRLQWSRGITAAETRGRRGIRARGSSFNGAAASLPRKPRTPDSDGDPMGLQWSRGITAAETADGVIIVGHTRQLQWSRGITAAETTGDPGGRRRARGFNGAAASLPRKPRAHSATPAARGRFNGAAASLPRKRRGPEDGVLARQASMEPRHHCRGNDAVRAGVQREVMLQWSRGITAAETHQDRHVRRLHRASMEPRHHCRGNGEVLATAEQPSTASMEPRHHCRGNTDGVDRRIRVAELQWSRGITAAETPDRNGAECGRGASMEPRHHCRGNVTRTTLSAMSGGFNGAAASLPRKPSGSMASSSRGSRFNGAAASLPRKHGHPTSTDRLTRFNGAAASLPRKLWTARRCA